MKVDFQKDILALPDGPGIYRIVCVSTEESYIGGASIILDRVRGHLHMLRRGEHHCKPLQRRFDKYGVESFAIEVLEMCELSAVGERERHWFDHFQPSLNLAPPRDMIRQGLTAKYRAIKTDARILARSGRFSEAADLMAKIGNHGAWYQEQCYRRRAEKARLLELTEVISPTLAPTPAVA